MTTTRIVAALVRKDARVVYRDRFMMLLLGYPLVIAVALRLCLKLDVLESLHFDLRLCLAPVVILFAGMLFGGIFGFALIEERENRTWLLLRVLPIEERTLFAYLFCMTTGLSLPISLAAALLYGQPIANLPLFLAMAIVSGMLAPLFMLAMGALCSNKIEGLVVSKAFSPVAFMPALVFLLSPAWQTTLLWNPFYWVYLGLLEAYAGPVGAAELVAHWPGYPAWLLVAAPSVLCGAASFWLARLYRSRAA